MNSFQLFRWRGPNAPADDTDDRKPKGESRPILPTLRRDVVQNLVLRKYILVQVRRIRFRTR